MHCAAGRPADCFDCAHARAARLAKGIAEGLPECVFEDKGFFVVNKLLDVAGPSEVLAIAAKLLPEALRLTSPQQGQHAWRGNTLLFKLVEALVRAAPHGRAPPCLAAGLLLLLPAAAGPCPAVEPLMGISWAPSMSARQAGDAFMRHCA